MVVSANVYDNPTLIFDSYQTSAKFILYNLFTLRSKYQKFEPDSPFSSLKLLKSIFLFDFRFFFPWKLPRKSSRSLLFLQQIQLTPHSKKMIYRITSLLLSIIILSSTLLEFSLAYTLNENMIINGNFTQPFAKETSYSVGAPLTIPGWYCSDSCQIDNCTYRIRQNIKNKIPFSNCTGQVLDIDAAGKIQNITQNVTLEYGYYELHFDYFWPYTKAFKKTLLVYFNQKLIFKFTPQLNIKIDKFKFSTIVAGNSGTNQLTFTETNDSFKFGDQVGFRIQNVSLRQISNNRLQQLLNNTIDSTVSKNINLMAGARVILSELLNMFVNLDRYQFYYYHNRSYSTDSLIFLKGISLLLKQKGTLVLKILSLTEYDSAISDFVQSLDFKKTYSQPSYLLKDDGGSGFLANNAVQALINIPIYLTLLLLGNMLYLVVKKNVMSRYLLKYTMYIVLLLMIIEGNVEQYSYYMFAELSNFFSASFKHKIVNVGLILFFYLFIITSVGFVWFVALHYKGRGRVLIKGKYNVLNFFVVMFERGIMYILLGAIHQLMTKNPSLQILMLIGVQFCFFVLKFTSLYKQLNKDRVGCFINTLQRITMLMFQFQFYFESSFSQKNGSEEDSTLKVTINIFLIVWALSCLHSVLKIINFILKKTKIIFQKICTPKRVAYSTKVNKQQKKTCEVIQNPNKAIANRLQRQHITDFSAARNKNSRIRLVYQIKRPQTKPAKRIALNNLFQRKGLEDQLKDQNSIRLKRSLQDKPRDQNKFLLLTYNNKK